MQLELGKARNSGFWVGKMPSKINGKLTYGWISTFFILAICFFLVAFKDPINENAVNDIFILIMTFILITIGFMDIEKIRQAMQWLKKDNNPKNFIFNSTSKWFEWLKWISITAGIYYAGHSFSDPILETVSYICYLALFLNIYLSISILIQHLLKPKENMLFNHWKVPYKYTSVTVSFILSLLIAAAIYIVVTHLVSRLPNLKMP